MKTGIWGAGYISRTHAEALKAAGIRIGAVVDIDAARAEAFAREYAIERWGTDASILLEKDITTVHVCTPPNLHYEMVMLLLEHGKNVLCEKPLCFDDEQAGELAAKAKEQGVVCGINLNVRFHMACQKARQVVESDSFGRVNLIHGSYLQEFHGFPAPLDWRYRTELAGPMRAVTEIGTHWLDLAEYISGRRIAALSADFGRFYRKRFLEHGMMYPDSDGGRRTETMNVPSEDAAAVLLRFDNGAMGTVLLSEVSHGRINRLSLEVTGEKENLWWNSEENNVLHTSVKGGGVHSEIFAFGNGFMDTFRSLTASFYEDVKAGKPCSHPVYPTFEDGERIVKLCNAMLKSADSEGRWVEIR